MQSLTKWHISTVSGYQKCMWTTGRYVKRATDYRLCRQAVAVLFSKTQMQTL